MTLAVMALLGEQARFGVATAREGSAGHLCVRARARARASARKARGDAPPPNRGAFAA